MNKTKLILVIANIDLATWSNDNIIVFVQNYKFGLYIVLHKIQINNYLDKFHNVLPYMLV